MLAQHFIKIIYAQNHSPFRIKPNLPLRNLQITSIGRPSQIPGTSRGISLTLMERRDREVPEMMIYFSAPSTALTEFFSQTYTFVT